MAGTTRGGKTVNPRDYTGRMKALAEAAHADEIAERDQEIAVAQAVESRRKQTEVVDYSQGGPGPSQEQPSRVSTMSPELAALIEEADEVEVGPQFVEIRVNTPIDDMVFGVKTERKTVPTVDGGTVEMDVPTGHLNIYPKFEPGVRYKVPVALAEHLDAIGYLYH